ncbi:MAG TPA: tetratricopeptide repeat protein [Steroidobacteraceae bacterium]|nr:tetratricopeptide repeat protein [Steroidobacteraceae bacterium]
MTTGIAMQWVKDALALHQAGRLADAEPLYLKAVDADKDFYPALHLMGVLRLQQGRAAEALPFIQRALGIQPNTPETLANYGIALEATGGYTEALEAFERVVNLNPNDSRAWNNRGALLSKVHRNEEALADLDRAVSLDPLYADAWMNRGTTLMAVSRMEDALECFDRVLRLRPDDLEARNSRGLALKAMGQAGHSLAEFDRVLKEKPDHLRALINRATVLGAMGRVEEELQSYDRALAARPDVAEVLIGRAYCLRTYKNDLAGAIADQQRAVAIQPDYPYARGDLVHMKMLAADWRGLTGELAVLNQGVREGKRVVNPYVYQGLSSSPGDLLASAKIYTQDKYPPLPIPRDRGRRQGKIRLGYLCSDFRAQATMHLSAGLFEHHDRSRFELIGFDNSPEDGSPMRRRVISAFDKFVPIQTLSDRAAAHLIAANDIDILVNLNGYFGTPRMGVCAHRPALLQVNYLGFPGSLGAEYMDYILADAEVIPKGEEPFYSEKVVRLPNSYQINDSLRPRPAPGIRAVHGLKETDFVFCHFNYSYKITPEIFALWLRLLSRVRSSVLWILESNALFAANLRSEAERAGIDPARLVFAARTEISAHLSRLALGDLFLDSLPYNAHTSASDALWAGLPLITCRGKAFAGRVAASLLRAVGLPELITESLDEYESLALALANDRMRLQSYRDRLTRDPGRLHLFDTARTTRHIEMAYETMIARWNKDELPESFSVPE